MKSCKLCGYLVSYVLLSYIAPVDGRANVGVTVPSGAKRCQSARLCPFKPSHGRHPLPRCAACRAVPPSPAYPPFDRASSRAASGFQPEVPRSPRARHTLFTRPGICSGAAFSTPSQVSLPQTFPPPCGFALTSVTVQKHVSPHFWRCTRSPSPYFGSVRSTSNTSPPTPAQRTASVAAWVGLPGQNVAGRTRDRGRKRAGQMAGGRTGAARRLPVPRGIPTPPASAPSLCLGAAGPGAQAERSLPLSTKSLNENPEASQSKT